MAEKYRSPSVDFAEQIKKQFAGDDRPATKEDVAALYRSFAIHQDAMVTLTAMLKAAVPQLSGLSHWLELEDLLKENIEVMGAALVQLNGDREVEE